jgi:uncharacterized membrane protein
MMLNQMRQPSGERAPLTGAFILGFAFSTFFDGILLHQVLQWHHLLSLARGELFRDMRVQMLADGLFHVMSYFLAIGGLVLLWRHRRSEPSDRTILACAVLGFAAWQFVDVILVHWAIGLHRVRVDVPSPLRWDIGWLTAFGLLPLIVGLWLLRKAPRSGDRTSRWSRVIMSLAALCAGVLSALPPGGAATVVVFRDGIDPAEAFVAVASAGGRVIWSAPRAEIMIIDAAASGTPNLYARGALLVTSGAWLGCYASSSAVASTGFPRKT